MNISCPSITFAPNQIISLEGQKLLSTNYKLFKQNSDNVSDNVLFILDFG